MNRIFYLLLFFFCQFSFASNLCVAEALEKTDLTIGRMKVTLMPEYDSRQVLVIYEGRFQDKDAFPAEALFVLPEGVTRLTDVCSLSPGGQHFCQLYEITKKGDRTETLVKLPYSDFFVDFQYAPFQPEAGKPRNFTFELYLPYPARILEVHIQKPYRVTDFMISPPSDDSYEKRDFTYYRYKMKDVKKGEILKFDISYNKEDVKPSVDIKFSVMGEQELVESKNGTVLLVVGAIILAVLASASFIRSKKEKV